MRPFFFARQLDSIRRKDEYLIACNPADHADVYICGGNHLGYLRAMGQKPNLIDRLTIRRNRSNYATAKSIMAHSEMMRRELVELYQVPSEKSAPSIRRRIQTAFPSIRTASPPHAGNTAGATMKPFSCFRLPAINARAWICWQNFSNAPGCLSGWR